MKPLRPGGGRRCRILAAALAAAALAALAASPAAAQGTGPAEPAEETAFDRHGMWIWYVDRSHGGNLARIVAQAKRAGVGTVYIKSGDSNDTWSQFTRALVRRLHAGGLDVCAWQFVYGTYPVGEAKVGAASVRKGADCLVIDAEGHYEGRYAQADTYIRRLRAAIGPDLPVSLASFPYVDYHPGFPYSVFLGPGGAQFNQPQMYWKAIQTSVRSVYEHTYLHNRVYKRPIYPIGQTYDSPGRAGIKLFRRFANSYGGLAPSWWSWQETNGAEWRALGARVKGRVAGYRPINSHPTLRRGSRGDLVVWAQQHLVGGGFDCEGRLPVTGLFAKITLCSVRRFQKARGLPVDGVIGPRTWRVLLRERPIRVRWAAPRATRGAARVAGGGSAPRSASLPAKAYEIDPGPRP